MLSFHRELSVEERDARTVFCMQLSSRIRSRDLEDFFSVVGKVNDVRIITDAKTRRSKGIAYVEFVDVESVPLVSVHEIFTLVESCVNAFILFIHNTTEFQVSLWLYSKAGF